MTRQRQDLVHGRAGAGEREPARPCGDAGERAPWQRAAATALTRRTCWWASVKGPARHDEEQRGVRQRARAARYACGAPGSTRVRPPLAARVGELEGSAAAVWHARRERMR